MKKTKLTFAEVAKELGVSLSTVWRWHLTGVKKHKLDSQLIGGRRFVTRSQLDIFLNHQPERKASELSRKIAKKKLDARGV